MYLSVYSVTRLYHLRDPHVPHAHLGRGHQGGHSCFAPISQNTTIHINCSNLHLHIPFERKKKTSIYTFYGDVDVYNAFIYRHWDVEARFVRQLATTLAEPVMHAIIRNKKKNNTCKCREYITATTSQWHILDGSNPSKYSLLARLPLLPVLINMNVSTH
jgi:hypothetical protein